MSHRKNPLHTLVRGGVLRPKTARSAAFPAARPGRPLNILANLNLEWNIGVNPPCPRSWRG